MSVFSKPMNYVRSTLKRPLSDFPMASAAYRAFNRVPDMASTIASAIGGGIGMTADKRHSFRGFATGSAIGGLGALGFYNRSQILNYGRKLFR